MRSIQELLPVNTKNKLVIQGRVPADLVAEVKKIMDRENLSWADVLTACLRHLVEEKTGKKK